MTLALNRAARDPSPASRAGLAPRLSGRAALLGRSCNKLAKHAVVLFNAKGKLDFDMETLRVAGRSMLIDVLSCREVDHHRRVVARVLPASRRPLDLRGFQLRRQRRTKQEVVEAKAGVAFERVPPVLPERVDALSRVKVPGVKTSAARVGRRHAD